MPSDWYSNSSLIGLVDRNIPACRDREGQENSFKAKKKKTKNRNML